MCLSPTIIASSRSSSLENELFQKGIWTQQTWNTNYQSIDILDFIQVLYVVWWKDSFGNSNKFLVATDEHEWEYEISSEKFERTVFVFELSSRVTSSIDSICKSNMYIHWFSFNSQHLNHEHWTTFKIVCFNSLKNIVFVLYICMLISS